MKKVCSILSLLLLFGFTLFSQSEAPTTNQNEETEQTPQEEYTLEEQSDVRAEKPIRVSNPAAVKTKAERILEHGKAKAEAAQAKQDFRRKRAAREIKNGELSIAFAENRIEQIKEQIELARKKGSMTEEEIQAQEERIVLVEERIAQLRESINLGKEKLEERQQ
ncbi:MAG: hypothetical protein AAGK97_10920 [Bacteroidota bacterium]